MLRDDQGGRRARARAHPRASRAARGVRHQAERAGHREPAGAVARRGVGARRRGGGGRGAAGAPGRGAGAGARLAAPTLLGAAPRRCWRAWWTGWPPRTATRCCGFCGIPGVGGARAAWCRSAAGSMLHQAVPGLGEVSRHPDATLRLAAVQALAQLGTPAALGLIEQAIEDDDRGVRLAAVRAVGARGYKGALKRVEGGGARARREGDGPDREDGVLRGLRRDRRRRPVSRR